MFDNAAEKIKKVATIYGMVGIIGSVLMGIVNLVNSAQNGYRPLGFWWIVIGALCAVGFYVTALFLHGYGELIENTSYSREVAQTLRKQAGQD